MSKNSVQNEMMSGEELVEAARSLRPKISAATDEIEQGRRIPLHIVAALKEAGVRMAMPQEWGGYEADPLTQMRVIEQLAMANASVAWCAMIGVDGGFFTGFMDQKVARELYPSLDLVTGSGVMPMGMAMVTEGGYQVMGRWPFGSGCQHSDWMAAGCIVARDGAPVINDTGIPETRVCLIPRTSVDILDTWRTTGLHGSGSHDWVVNGVFVPEERTFNIMSPTLHRTGPLYRLPSMFFMKFPGAALGVARSAIDTVIQLARDKFIPITGTTLSQEAHVQTAIGQAEALVGSARAYVVETTRDVWQALVQSTGERRSKASRFHPNTAYAELTVEQRARHRLAMTHVHTACVQAVQLMYKIGGSMSLYATSPLDRHLRDVTTMNQHNVVSMKSYETAGQMLVGLEPSQPFF
jgi:indole-3-acetate monooxygenase